MMNKIVNFYKNNRISMLMLAIANLCFILLINDIRIQDLLKAWNESNFRDVIHIAMFLFALDFLSCIALIGYNKNFSKYIYPIILLLYITYLSCFGIKYHRGNDLSNGLSSEMYPASEIPLSDSNNIAFVNVKLSDLGIKGTVKLDIKPDYLDVYKAREDIISASWITPAKCMLYNPIAFFSDFKLATGATFKVERVLATANSIDKYDNNKIKLDYTLHILCSVKIDYLKDSICRSKTISIQHQKLEISIKPKNKR